MPKSAFNAIESSVRTFLGGARVALVEVDKADSVTDLGDPCEIVNFLEVDGTSYRFYASRKELAFTATEVSLPVFQPQATSHIFVPHC